jgi:polar amino acid transport system permease protein
MSAMSEPATVERKQVSGPALLGGIAVLVALAAAGIGLHAELFPEPVVEVFNYVFSSFLLDGAVAALKIAALSMVGGVILGLGLALMRLSPLAPVRGSAWLYIWFIRGTPLILQLVFLYDALPALGIRLDSFTTAVIGFTLNEAAFCGEIIRGGILSVDRKQVLAWGRSSPCAASCCRRRCARSCPLWPTRPSP